MLCHFNDRVTSATLRESANVSDTLRFATINRNERHHGLGRVRGLSAAVMGGQQHNTALNGKASLASGHSWNLNGMVVVADAPWTKILPSLLDAEGVNPMGVGLQDRLQGSKSSKAIALLTTEYSGSDSLWTLSPSANVEDDSGRFRKIPIST
ncbi:MAG: hypothetical protein HY862_17875 [Chloroflexi bacterium]|nr:hypothetical protein [Chloroflexota bacterium]